MEDFVSDLRKLLRFVATSRTLDAQLPAQCLHVLLVVATKPGVTQVELQRHTGLSPASVSRNIGTLSVASRNGEPGYGLVAQLPNAIDTRAADIFLTTKGLEMVRRLLSAATGNPADNFRPPTVR